MDAPTEERHPGTTSIDTHTSLDILRALNAEDATVAGVARAVVAHEPKAGQAALIARLFLKAQQMTVEEREQLRRDDGRPDKLTVSS